MAIVTFLPLVWSGWACVIEGRHAVVPGLLVAAAAAVTVYCTAMIYASLKSVDAWHSGLTPACYLLFAATGGVLLGGLFRIAGGLPASGMALAGIVLLAVAWGAKIAWWRRLRALRSASTPETATGLGFIGRVRLFERPHTNENYLTREMGFRIARKHAAKLSRLAVLIGGLAPAVLLLLVAVLGQGAFAFALQLVAALLYGCGVLTERWLFFAQARHAVMNYYGG